MFEIGKVFAFYNVNIVLDYAMFAYVLARNTCAKTSQNVNVYTIFFLCNTV